MERALAPEIVRQRRRRWRRWSLLFFGLFAGALVVAGWRGWEVNFLPAHYLGYAMAVFGLLGACGLNIWYAGPLDPRFDPVGVKASTPPRRAARPYSK